MVIIKIVKITFVKFIILPAIAMAALSAGGYLYWKSNEKQPKYLI